jgi:hypothetical protein
LTKLVISGHLNGSAISAARFITSSSFSLKAQMSGFVPLGPILFLLAVHWFADFVLQTDWQAANKGKNLSALSQHVGVYTSALGISSILLFPFSPMRWATFTILNGSLHFITDFATSRVLAKRAKSDNPHGFFIIIGLDQLIHQITLVTTMCFIYYT